MLLMRFGICGTEEDWGAALGAGFDYVEVAASGLTDAGGPELYATNLFFAPGVRLFGPEATAWYEAAERTIARAAARGAEAMVVGSGGQRQSPEGFDGEAGFAAVAGALARFGEGRGVTIAPESLNRRETNVGNGLGDLARRMRSVGAGFTADSHHVLVEWDLDGRPGAVEELWEREVPFAPDHVHLAPLDRSPPRRDDPMLRAFAGRLRALGYDAGLSYEGSRPDGFSFAGLLAEMRALLG